MHKGKGPADFPARRLCQVVRRVIACLDIKHWLTTAKEKGGVVRNGKWNMEDGKLADDGADRALVAGVGIGGDGRIQSEFNPSGSRLLR
jgi:hypothetical protein